MLPVPTRPARRLPRRYAALAGAVASVLVAAGCSTGGGAEPAEDAGAAPATTAPTTLAELDTAAVVVPREDPCEGVPEAAVLAALGSPAVDAERWADGERARLSPRVRDVAHEWGCAFTAADGGAARAWVFAPPLTPARAAQVAAAVVSEEGCAPVAGAAAFGRSSAARVCRQGDVLVAAWSGLFGDAWLSCSLGAPRGEADTPVAREALVARASTWCAAVLTAARET